MIDDMPWEPPFAGSEAEHLTGALDRLRTTFRWKADGLDAAGLRTRIGASSLTLAGLLKHLAHVEAVTFTWKMRGTSPGKRWETADKDWVFASADTDEPAELYALWDEEAATARTRLAEAIAAGGLDQPIELTGPDGEHASLRRLVCDLLEEYGRHTGHADLLREAVDGRVGEDPPPGWKAESGAGLPLT
jgi:hypothetical protein